MWNCPEDIKDFTKWLITFIQYLIHVVFPICNFTTAALKVSMLQWHEMSHRHLFTSAQKRRRMFVILQTKQTLSRFYFPNSLLVVHARTFAHTELKCSLSSQQRAVWSSPPAAVTVWLWGCMATTCTQKQPLPFVVWAEQSRIYTLN